MEFETVFVVGCVCFLVVALAVPVVSLVRLREDHARLSEFTRPAPVGRAFAVELAVWAVAVLAAGLLLALYYGVMLFGVAQAGHGVPRAEAATVTPLALIFVFLVLGLLAFAGLRIHERAASKLFNEKTAGWDELPLGGAGR